MRKALWLMILQILLPGCLPSCFEIFGKGSTESHPYPGMPPEEVWEALQRAVNDYYDIRLADDEEMYLESEWNEHLAPMYKSGRRLRVRAWVRVHEETGLPYLEVTVDREINTNMERPLESSEADWETDWDVDGRDEAREHRIIWLVNLRLKEIAPSKKILEQRPSEYSMTPEEKRNRNLWGEAEGGKGKPGEGLWE